MNDTLSIVLPVHNSQDTIGRRVDTLLEVLSDLASEFEVVIVDDGSTDQTEEIAREMAREFPQLRVVRHPWRLGAERSLKTGLELSRGDIVFVQDDDAPISPTDLRRLWELRKESDVIMARPDKRHSTIPPSLMNRLMDWGRTLTRSASERAGQGGIQMIRRCALHDLEPTKQVGKPHGINVVAWADEGTARERRSPRFMSHVTKFTLGE